MNDNQNAVCMEKSWLRFFLWMVLLIGVSLHPVSAQSVPASPGPPRKPLMEVLLELNRARGVYFLFSQQRIGGILVTPPDLSSNASVEKLLAQTLHNTGLVFKKVDDRTFVILTRKKQAIASDPRVVQGSAYPDDEPADEPPAEPASNTISSKII